MAERQLVTGTLYVVLYVARGVNSVDSRALGRFIQHSKTREGLCRVACNSKTREGLPGHLSD